MTTETQRPIAVFDETTGELRYALLHSGTGRGVYIPVEGQSAFWMEFTWLAYPAPAPKSWPVVLLPPAAIRALDGVPAERLPHILHRIPSPPTP